MAKDVKKFFKNFKYFVSLFEKIPQLFPLLVASDQNL